MKLKITDVRDVIGELISETWSPHDVQRPWKIPTAEERVRMEREFGMRLRWDAILASEKFDDFQGKWHTPRYGRVQSLLYYTVGVAVKDVHSTLDNGYAICTVAVAYDSPFGKPSEYWVAGYGPKPAMEDLDKTIQKNMISSRREVLGSDRLDDWLKSALFHPYTSEIIYRSVAKQAKDMNTIFTLGPNKSHDFKINFINPEHMQFAVRKAETDIRTWIHKDYPDMMIRIKADYTYTGMDIAILIYNKYTNQMLGIMNYTNVDINAPRKYD